MNLRSIPRQNNTKHIFSSYFQYVHILTCFLSFSKMLQIQKRNYPVICQKSSVHLTSCVDNTSTVLLLHWNLPAGLQNSACPSPLSVPPHMHILISSPATSKTLVLPFLPRAAPPHTTLHYTTLCWRERAIGIYSSGDMPTFIERYQQLLLKEF